MLLILLYHRVGGPAADGGNSPAVLAGHFRYLSDHAVVKLPGEPLEPGRLNVCLTFDDAYADFYYHVFPLLQKFSFPAILAVPTRFILEDTALSRASRLDVMQSDAMRADVCEAKAPFCTWAELRQMTASGLVQAASHSHNHWDMRQPATDVEYEAVHSQGLITKHLGCAASAFVYPYGRVNGGVRRAVRQHYEFDLRIGSAINWSWKPRGQPLCRLPVDGTPDLAAVLRGTSLAGLGLKMFCNQLRAFCGKWGGRGY
jgi:peptidoglycan/xylan/chitin deacetylase (PgdA/CDA1 family)